VGTITPHPAAQGGRLQPPQPLNPGHDLSAFDSTSPDLNDWLRRRAWPNQQSGASRTYVICQGSRVVAFYCLANGSVLHVDTPSKIRRNMPEPIPVMILGRLAVDREFERRGIGRALLGNAILRTLQAAEISGIRAILVHAEDDKALAFYERHGFLNSPTNPLTLMLSLKDARAQIE
jgi:ribosomal protein S18 acetylase RimI-like enzyme